MAFRRFRPEEEVERLTPETWLGELFGHINSADTEMEKAQQLTANDAWRGVPLIGDFIADIGKSNIERTMNPKITRKWNAGVEQGDRTWSETLGKFEEAKTTITNYVNGKKAEIDSVIAKARDDINYVRDRALEAKAVASDAVNKVNAVRSEVSNISGIADSALSKSNSALSNANNAIDRVNQALNDLDALKSRVSKLESQQPKTTQPTQPFKWPTFGK